MKLLFYYFFSKKPLYVFNEKKSRYIIIQNIFIPCYVMFILSFKVLRMRLEKINLI